MKFKSAHIIISNKSTSVFLQALEMQNLSAFMKLKVYCKGRTEQE